MASRRVECDQVVLAWSSANLLGGSGLGPVAASERWTLSSRDATAGLSDAARYLTDGANQALAAGLTPPLCLEFRPGTDATLIVAKAYHTGSRRAGHYQVHALRDPSRTLSPWDLWRQASAGVLRVTAASDEEPGRLPTVEVTAASATRGALDDADRERLSLLLGSLVAGRPFLVRASDQPQGERLLRRLLGALPLPLSRTIPVTTMATSQASWPTGMALVVPPFSQGFEKVVVDVDLDAGVQRTPRGSDEGLASALLAATPAEVRGLRSVAELRSWAALRSADLGELDGRRLEGAVDGPLVPTLLARLADDPRRGEVVARIAADPGLAARFGASLREASGEYGDLVAALFRGDDAGAGSGSAAKVQDWLVREVGAETFADSLVGPLVAESRGRRVVVGSVALADALALPLGRDAALFDFDYTVTTSTWTPLSAAQVIDALRGEKNVPDGLWRVAATAPDAVGAMFDSLHRAVRGRFVEFVRRWPDAHVAAAVEGLLRTQEAPLSAVFEVLAGRPEPVQEDVLRALWPRMARHVGVPDDVAARLVVQKRRWWN